MINRRHFLSGLAATLAAPCIREDTKAQSTTAPLWGGPVLDIHSHLRQGLDANVTHMQGCGVTNAVLLARATAVEQVKAIQAKYPKRFVWSVLLCTLFGAVFCALFGASERESRAFTDA
jgi:hypothetical protein